MVNETFKILVDDADHGLQLVIEHYGDQLSMQIGRLIQNDDELIKDVYQDTLITIWMDHKKIGELEEPFLWIMVVARNTALNTLRGEKIRLKESIEDHEYLYSTEQADTDLIYKEMLDHVVLQATLLTPMEKEIFIASKVDGLNNKELEKVYNIKPQRVRNLLSSAKSKIRKLLQRWLD